MTADARLLVHRAHRGGRPRWFLAFVLGVVLCLGVFFVSNVGLQLWLGRDLVGIDYALVGTAVVTIVVFALLHGYQGVAGMIDSGIFGGVALTLVFLWRGGRLTACAVAHAGWNSLAAIGIWLWY